MEDEQAIEMVEMDTQGIALSVLFIAVGVTAVFTVVGGFFASYSSDIGGTVDQSLLRDLEGNSSEDLSRTLRAGRNASSGSEDNAGIIAESEQDVFTISALPRIALEFGQAALRIPVYVSIVTKEVGLPNWFAVLLIGLAVIAATLTVGKTVGAIFSR